MTMSHVVDPIEQLAMDADGEQAAPMAVGGLGAIARSEVEAQLSAAHKYKRSITNFLREATSLATVTREVAESCMYSLPRAGKAIEGPSVRLAEICASAWGNLHIGARIVDIEEKDVVAQGVAWDLEKNIRVTVETRRRITNSRGARFNDDMITVTGNAGASIALRNAIFRVVPRSYVDRIYAQVRAVAIGDAKTLVTRRAEVLDRLQKMGVTQERVLAKLDKKGLEDIGLDELGVLIGLTTAIRENAATVDEAFPAPTPAPAAPEQDGRRISMKGPKAADKPQEKPAAETKPETSAKPEPPEPGSAG